MPNLAMNDPALARRTMVYNQLYTNQVTDPRLLDALINVPREAFLPVELRGAAYVDDHLPAGNGRYLIAPITLGRMLASVSVQPQWNILVVGAAPGYACAVLAQLAARVLGTEDSVERADWANANLSALKLWHAKVQPVKQLAEGFAEEGPYDLILLGGAALHMPQRLALQLRDGGVMLMVKRAQPLRALPGQEFSAGHAVRIERIGSQFAERDLFDSSLPELDGIMG